MDQPTVDPSTLTVKKDDVVILDIETTGLKDSDQCTIVGLMIDGKIVQHMQQDFKSLRINCNTLITYNGKRFDLPFLKRVLPNADLQITYANHIDLMESAAEALSKRTHSSGQPSYIKKDEAVRLMGIYCPRDPAGSGYKCALISKALVDGKLKDDMGVFAEVSIHNALDLYATQALYYSFIKWNLIK